MRELDPEKVLYTKTKLYHWRPAFDVFLKHLDHACDPNDGIHEIPNKGQRVMRGVGSKLG